MPSSPTDAPGIGTEQRAVILEIANRVALDILASRTGEEALLRIAEAARVLADARYAALGAHAAVAIHHLQLLSHLRALVRALIRAQEEERRTVAHALRCAV